MIAKSASVALLGCLLIAPANGQTSKQEKELMNEFVNEYVTCSAYYMTSTQCLEDRGENANLDLIARLKESASVALARAIAAGELLNILPQTHSARLAITFRTMKDEIKHCRNLAIIVNRHHRTCSFMMEHPKEALDRYLAGRSLED